VLRRPGRVFLGLAVSFDATAAAAAWMACYVVRFRLGLFPYVEPTPPGPGPFARLLPIVVLCDLVGLAAVGLYRPTRAGSLYKELVQVAKAGVLAWMGMLAVFYYVSRTPYSRVMLFLFLVVNPAALMLARVGLRRALLALRWRGVGVRRAAIVGTGRLAQEAFHKLRFTPWLGVQVEYFVSEEESARKRDIRGVPVRGGLADLVHTVRSHPVEMALVAIPGRKSGRLEAVLDRLARVPVSVAVIPDFKGVVTMRSSVGELEGVQAIQLGETPQYGWEAAAKRAMDVVGALVLLALFGLPMLILAVLVKLTSPGPILYRQERMGLGGRPFIMLKFRSMRADAEEETGPVWARPGDPRRTRLGAFMRRTSLDELPQLLNVLKGDMSLVGPRPERPVFVREFAEQLPAYMLRHKVKAGLTGWAQVNGYRGDTSLRKRLLYDLYYINNWSLGFDLFILLLTPFAGLASRNAY